MLNVMPKFVCLDIVNLNKQHMVNMELHLHIVNTLIQIRIFFVTFFTIRILVLIKVIPFHLPKIWWVKLCGACACGIVEVCTTRPHTI